MSNWRLTTDAIAIIIDNERVYLASTEKKQYLTAVEAIIKFSEPVGSSKSQIRLEENSFRLVIKGNFDSDENLCDIGFYVKSDLLPDPEKLYRVCNADCNHSSQLLMYVPNTHGDFGDTEFEAIFNTNNEVSFTNPLLKNYRKCSEELKRRINFDIHKKTRKFVPGRRYDTLEETRYILCNIKSLRDRSKLSSDFLSLLKDMKSGYLYVNELPAGAKTVSEILKAGTIYTFNNENLLVDSSIPQIKVACESTMMAEGDFFLEDDFSGNIKDYWPNFVKNIDTIVKKDPENRGVYVTNLLNIFTLCSDGQEYSTDEKNTELIKNSFSVLIDEVIKNNWDRISFGYTNISTSNTDTENIKNCQSLLALDLYDNNPIKSEFYKNMLTFFKIDLTDRINSQIATWRLKLTEMSTNFNSFFENKEYFKVRQTTDWTFRQRVNSTNYKMEVITLESRLTATSELKDTIIDLANSAKLTGGKGVEKFNVYNIGTKKFPKEFISITISLNDVVKYLKGVDNMSESLKNEIITRKFVDCTIECDLNGTIE